MSNVKGSVYDASGERIKSIRITTDIDASTGIGSSSDPLRVDPTGTTVQPVAIVSGGGTGGTASSFAAAFPSTGTAIGVKNGSNMVNLTADNSGNLHVNLAAGTISGGNAAASATGSPVPANADYLGASDGTNLQGLLVESAAHPNLRVGIYSGANEVTITGANALKVDGSAVTQPVSGTVSTTPPSHASTNVDQLNGTTVDTNSGTKSAGTLRVVIATDQPQLTNALKVDGSGVTQPVSQSGTWTVQPGNTANTTPWLVQPVAQATGGMSFFSQSLTSTKAQVKGSGGTIYGITAVNNGTAIAYIQVFNKASASVTVGTTTPDYVIPVPAPSSGSNGAGIREEYALGLNFGTGITVACTTTRTGASSATCDVNVNYV